METKKAMRCPKSIVYNLIVTTPSTRQKNPPSPSPQVARANTRSTWSAQYNFAE
jgi:hypothetical protein